MFISNSGRLMKLVVSSRCRKNIELLSISMWWLCSIVSMLLKVDVVGVCMCLGVGMINYSSVSVSRVRMEVVVNRFGSLLIVFSGGFRINVSRNVRLIDILMMFIILLWFLLWVRLVVSVVLVLVIVFMFCKVWLMMMLVSVCDIVVISLFVVNMFRFMLIVGL